MSTVRPHLGVYLIPAVLFLSQAAMAESLGEPDIRALYAEADAALLNGEKTHEIMQKRFDDHLQFTVKSTQVLEGMPPHTETLTMTKSQVIEADTKTRAMTTISSHSNMIYDIKFSPDHQWAYVSDSTLVAGVMRVPVQNGKTVAVNYTDAVSCVDTLGLADALLRLMRSDCKEQVAIKKP